MTKLQFDLEWRTTLFTLVLLPALVLLGIWQLHRADEKTALATNWAQRQQLTPVALQQLGTADDSELAYRRVTLTGHFVPDRYLLLDNRIHRGRFGYEVVGQFQLAGGAQTVLINRGWLAGDSARRMLPAVSQPQGSQTVTGYVYVATDKPFSLGEQPLEAGWPKRVQNLDMQLLIASLGGGSSLFPYPVRLDAAQPGALTVDWQVVNVSGAKHRAYAAQWFAMAAALLILFVLRSSNLWSIMRNKRQGLAPND